MAAWFIAGATLAASGALTGTRASNRRDWSGDMAHDPHGEAPVRVDVALEVDGARYARLWADTLLGRMGQR